jgi:hypothetical protein
LIRLVFGDFAQDAPHHFSGTRLGHAGANWILSDKAPLGIMDKKADARLELENYVAEHGTLPPKTPVPDIEFNTLDGRKQMKLSSLKSLLNSTPSERTGSPRFFGVTNVGPFGQ